MLQRVQTIFLLISVMLFAVTSYFTFASGDLFEVRSYGIRSLDGQTMEDVSTYYFILPMALAAAITLFAIFMFGNRQRQMAFVRITFILYAISFALLALCIKDCQTLLTPTDNFTLGVSFYTPFVSLILNMLALRAIRKDDKLVRSVDRIR